MVLKLLTYNLLAPIFVGVDAQPFSFFSHVPPEDLAWCARRPRLERFLTTVEADVVCLQEVQYEPGDPTQGQLPWRPPRWLVEAAEVRGYTVVPVPLDAKRLEQQADRNERVAGGRAVVGLVTLLEAERFVLLEVLTSSKSVIVRFSRRGDLFTVANVHLEGHPDKGEERVQQLLRALEKARSGPATHVIVAGDFNSTLAADTPLGRAVSSLSDMSRVDVGPTYNGGPGRIFALDHILYDRSLAADNAAAGIAPDDLQRGMPNASSASDHAPVQVELTVVTPPAAATSVEPELDLDPSERASLSRAWEALMAQAPPQPKGPPAEAELEALRTFKAKKQAFLEHLPSEAHRRYLKHRR